MKKILLFVAFAGTHFFAEAQNKVVWTCPMHPQINRSSAGKCPLCGMDLVKKTLKAATPKSVPGKEKTKKPAEKLPEPADVRNDTLDKKEMHQHEQEMKMDTVGSDSANQIQNEVNVLPGKTVRYDLYVSDTIVNFTGKSKSAIAINGSIPAPALIFTEGDTAVIYLDNRLKEETSLHWHGVILPNQADGVPFLTTAPISSGESHLYKFRVVQNGTYWYHSHSSLQEQAGMYGALIFKHRAASGPPSSGMDHSSISPLTGHNLFDKEYTVVLSEWTDENPMQIQRRLRTANDWYSIKKRSTQSYAEAIGQGHFKTKLTNEWKRMRAMDVSDVYYNRFLVNGKPVVNAPEFKKGDKIRLQIVNAGASSYFWLGFAGGKITVTGNDGNDMVPIQVDRLIIAPAETYDVVVTVPEDMSYEFRATSEDRTGYASLWLGSGHQMPARTLERLHYFEGMKMMNDMMNMDGSMDDMGMNMSNQKMDMNSVMYPEIIDQNSGSDTMQMEHSDHTMKSMHGMGGSSDLVTLNYDMLRSPVKTSLSAERTKVLNFMLTGNMNRYLWTLDNKTVKESDRILINQGEVLRLVITNNSMMRHPMHLHGHDFRVVNSQGEYSPLKNVIDIMPMETDTIEFAANQSGNWFFHCHILFHMMAGMGRVFTYNNSPVNPELPDGEKAYQAFRRHKDQNMIHLMARAGLETNGSDGEAMLSTNRWALKQVWHLGYSAHHGFESETMIGRYFGANQWWYPYVGFDYHYKKVEGEKHEHSDYHNLFGQVSNKNDRNTFVVGVEYTLPWLVLADARVDGDGKFRVQLSREDIPITSRLRFAFMGNTDREYMVGLRYVVTKWFAVSSHYDSDMRLGAGITLIY